ncbi:squamosa promoter-binding-like protein 3 [Nicotiana tabacum]|uniref:Squamosa promoter-binding-like protein 3 n=1 Tax=Nicotiana tabacum TaxID=4097 RepID=A0AC58S4S1_TOBAC
MATHIHGMLLKNIAENNDFDEEEETEEEEEESNLKRKRLNVEKKKGSNSEGPCCQVEKCGLDLSGAKKYYKRHKLCQVHAKAPIVFVAGLRQRILEKAMTFMKFTQRQHSGELITRDQSWFHEVSEFDGTKRSCRRRLAGHNERRRKTPLVH